MKVLIVLLACVAASNAFYTYNAYHCPSGYSFKPFWVLPSSSCFSYTVYSCGAWFSTNYYADVMKVYPGENCEEMEEDAFRQDCVDKLAAKAGEIKDDMDNKKEEWTGDLDEIVDAAIESFNEKVDAYVEEIRGDLTDEEVAELEGARDQAKLDYADKVNEMREDAKTAYGERHDAIYEKVLEFHENVVEAAVKSYQKREEMIGEFAENFDERVGCYVERFKTVMGQINERKVETYGCLLERAYDSELIDAVVAEYETSLGDELKAKCIEYEEQLMGYKDEIVESYRCAYQIVTYSGCLVFNRESYSAYCREIGNWWSFTCDRTISCFKFVNYSYSWSKGQYRNLIECKVDEVITPIETIGEELNGKVQEAVEAATTAFNEWKDTWPTDYDEAVEAFGEIITARHALLCESCKAGFLCKYGSWCEAFESELEDYEATLEEKKTEAMDNYREYLQDRYQKGCEWFQGSLEKYEERITCVADRILTCYTACVEKREEKLGEYSECLQQRKNDLRGKLETKLGDLSECKIEQFTELLVYYHGDQDAWSDAVVQYFDAYSGSLVDEEGAVLDDFDCYWDDLIPRLEEHYACSYKCSVNVEFKAPEYCPANWYIVMPTASCYPYKLSYFTRCYNYSIHYVGGTYTWCA